MKNSLYLLVLVLSAAVAGAQTPMVYDDDGPVMDVGAVTNFGVFYKMVDKGWINPLATIADSSNDLSAPGIHALAAYYQHTEIPIGANQQNAPDSPLCTRLSCNHSTWNTAWMAKFDPVASDTRANYEGCTQLYRKALASQPNRSVVIVETGFATCLMQLLGSSADSYSALTGEQLAKAKVKELGIMGGDYPTGQEWNFQSDAADYTALFSAWTRQNGFPPIYVVGWTLGNIACSGAPGDAPIDKNPIRNAVHAASQADAGCVTGEQRPVWDQLAMMFGAWGPSYREMTYFRISPGGTNTVDRATGKNSWSNATDSGHYYLIAKGSPEAFAAFLDGYSHSGFLALPPAVGARAMKH